MVNLTLLKSWAMFNCSRFIQVGRMLLMVLLLIPFMSQSAEGVDPYQVMQKAADNTFKRLAKEQKAIRKNPDYLRTVVKEELIPYVDVRYAGASVLGRYFRDATPSQRDAYFKAFEAYLAQAYGQALSMYTNQKYEMSPVKPVGAKTMEAIRITLIEPGGRPPIRLDFQWRKNSKTGEWRAYDMSAEGVSMITTKQNEWAGTLRQGGVSALTKVLEQAAKQKITLEQSK